MEILEKEFQLAVAEYSHLRRGDFTCFFSREKNVVVRGVHIAGKAVGREAAAEMVAASRGNVEGAADLFVLNVPARDRKHLCAEAEFAGDRITFQLAIVRLEGRGVAFDQRGLF